MENIVEIFEMGICCLIPIYQQNTGNATKLITDQGTCFIDKRMIKTVLKLLCKHYTIHMESCREKYGTIIHRQLGVPLPIHSRLLLIPLKMRKPMFGKDGAYGYVNLYGIESLEEQNGYTVICLQSGIKVPSLHKLQTVRRQINQAKLVAGNIPTVQSGEGVREALDVFYETCEHPATKADIAILTKEILELRRVLKKGTLIHRNEELKIKSE
ncbi:hypothetical protein [Geosporobacter ferrireducens]|uniref:Uncharacterized protein n=1 Tax=Geosporobacter ferrireducens TaxID=1424294 RepID=A0A1D8GGN6_9FIRM|nr:hypothetical protein [Geosporobacter ferrireducens]AOT70036.1 hypothetical protein Gferi_10815 [Geosporobacter ferrireducens]